VSSDSQKLILSVHIASATYLAGRLSVHVNMCSAKSPQPGWREKTLAYYFGKIKSIASKIKWSFFISIILVLILAWLSLKIENKFLTVLFGLFAGVLLAGTVAFGLLTRFFSTNRYARMITAGLPPYVQIEEVLQALNVAQNFSPPIIEKLSGCLADTKLGSLEQMVKARASSVLTLSMDINLKHTRRLIYELFFDDTFWDNRRAYNVIYELSSFNSQNRIYRINKKLKWKATQEDRDLLLKDCQNMNPVAEDARNMGTTLWFDDNDQKEKRLRQIVACGQFTTCVNLLEYILSLVRSHEAGLLDISPDKLDLLTQLQKTISKDWIRFKTDPFFLFDACTNSSLKSNYGEPRRCF
jgi:hypothetical protein